MILLMKKKYSIILDDEFLQYCKLNNIEEIEKFASVVFDKGFTIIKYGEKPNIESYIVNETINKLKKEETNNKTSNNPIKKEMDLYDE
jgi:hypothetical protein